MINSIFIPMIILATIGNILWFSIKSILSDNGFKVTYWYGHMKDIPNFKKLINSTENKSRKVKYNRMFWGLIIVLVLFLAIALSNFYLIYKVIPK